MVITPAQLRPDAQVQGCEQCLARLAMPAFEVALSRVHAIQKEQALGLCFVFCVAVIWVAASFLVQDLEARGINPFVLTYIANTLFLVLLPVSALSRKSEVASTPKYVFAMHCWCIGAVLVTLQTLIGRRLRQPNRKTSVYWFLVILTSAHTLLPQ